MAKLIGIACVLCALVWSGAAFVLLNPSTGMSGYTTDIISNGTTVCAWDQQLFYVSNDGGNTFIAPLTFPPFRRPTLVGYSGSVFWAQDDQAVWVSNDCVSWSQGKTASFGPQTGTTGILNGQNVIVGINENQIQYTNADATNSLKTIDLSGKYNNTADCPLSVISWNPFQQHFILLAATSPMTPCQMVVTKDFQNLQFFTTPFPPFLTTTYTIAGYTQTAVFIAEMSQGNFYHSLSRTDNDGTYSDWEPVVLINSTEAAQVVAAGSTLLALGPWVDCPLMATANQAAYGGSVYISTDDGKTWSDAYPNIGLSKIVASGNKFLGSGCFGRMATSTDGITWTDVNNPQGFAWTDQNILVGTFRYPVNPSQPNGPTACLAWGGDPMYVQPLNYFYAANCSQPWLPTSSVYPSPHDPPHSMAYFPPTGTYYVASLQDQRVLSSKSFSGPYEPTQFSVNEPDMVMQEIQLIVTPHGLLGIASLANQTGNGGRCMWAFVTWDGSNAQETFNCSVGDYHWGMAKILYAQQIQRFITYANQVGPIFVSTSGLDWVPIDSAPTSIWAMTEDQDGVLYALAFHLDGTIMSTDGYNWAVVSGSSSPFGAASLESAFLLTCGNKVVAVSGDSRGSFIVYTSDSGRTWTTLANPPIQVINPACQNRGSTLYFAQVDGTLFTMQVPQ